MHIKQPLSIDTSISPLMDVLAKEQSQSLSQETQIPSKDLKTALDKIFKETVRDCTHAHVYENISQLASIITLEQLQDAIRHEFPTHKDALSAARAMLKEAQEYLATQTAPQALSLQEHAYRCFCHVVDLIETLLSYLGMKNFFHLISNDEEAEEKFQKVNTILSLVYYLTITLISLINVGLGRIIIGSLLLLIGTLSWILPFFRHIPIHIPHVENLTQQASQGLLPKPLFSNNKVLDEIAHRLASRTLTQSQPLLIGKKGSLSIQIIHSLVHAIQAGKYPHLQNKQIFYIPTSAFFDLHAPDEGRPPLSSTLVRAMQRHKKECIFVLDNFHLISDLPKALLLQLTDMFNQGENGPSVIGMTGVEDPSSHIGSLKDCYTPITLDEPDANETVSILQNYLLKTAPTISVERDALYYLASKTKDLFSNGKAVIDIALRALNECVRGFRNPPQAPLEQKLQAALRVRENLSTQNRLSFDTGFLPYSEFSLEIQKVEKDIAELENLLRIEKEKKKHLEETRNFLFEARTTMMQSIVKIGRLQQTLLAPEDKIELNRFILVSHFLIPSLIKTVQEQASDLHIPASLNKACIDDALQEERRQLTWRV